MNFKKITDTQTFRESSLTSSATIINAALGAIFYFLVAKILGSYQFGIFSFVVAGIASVGVFVDFGLDQGLVKFISRGQNSSQVLAITLITKIVAGLLITLLSLSLADVVSGRLFSNPELAFYVPMVGVGVLTQSLFMFAVSYAQAKQAYWQWSLLYIGTNLARLVVVLGLSKLHAVTSYSISLVYIGAPLAGFICFWPQVSNLITTITYKSRPNLIRDLLSFNKWIAGFKILATVGSRLDIFFSIRFLGLAPTGIYSLVNQLVSIFPQLSTALGVVTSSKLASFETQQKNTLFVKKTFWLATFTAIATSLLIFSGSFIVFHFAGFEIGPALTPLLILLVSMAFFHILTPFRDSILYFHGKSNFIFFQNLIQLFITASAGFILIPRLGLTGSALIVLIAQVFNAITSLWYYQRLEPSLL